MVIIDYVEEKGGNLFEFEIKWNPKAKVKFPTSFVETYSSIDKLVINRDNFEQYLK